MTNVNNQSSFQIGLEKKKFQFPDTIFLKKQTKKGGKTHSLRKEKSRKRRERREMVALSLYKGNLHKVPDVPRQWPIPAPTISLKDFKNLLRRRNRALSRLRSDVIADVDPTSRPNSAPSPNPNPKNTDADPVPAGNAVNRKDTGNHVGDSCSEPELPAKGDSKEGEGEENEANQERKMVDEGLVEAEDSSRKLLEKTDALAEGKNEKNNDKTEAPENPEVHS